MKSLNSFEKSIEERFDKKSYTINESHFEDFNQKKQKVHKPFFFHVEFSSSIPEETKIFLNEKIPSIMDFPLKYGLDIPHANILLRFIDKTTFEKEIGIPFPENIRLPASNIKIEHTLKKYKITIIIPKIIDKAEIVVNITRNIFSKLCGNIFFKEEILPLEFYQHSKKGGTKISASIPEILDLLNEFIFHSKTLKLYSENYSELNKINLREKKNELKTQIINEWAIKYQEQRLSPKEEQIIQSIFRDFFKEFKKNHEYFYKSISKSIKKLNSRMNFILPHEIVVYRNFEKQKFVHYIRSVKNKLEEIDSLVGFIEEINSLMTLPPQEDYLEILGSLIRSHMREMRKGNKIFDYHSPEIKNNFGENNIKKISPLFFVKMIPRGTPLKDWAKEVKRIEQNYKSSTYNKLYLSLKTINHWIIKNQELGNRNFQESEEGGNLKKLINQIKFLEKSFRTLKNNLGVFLDIIENISFEEKKLNTKLTIPLDDFLKAWSYFISSILTLLYYKKNPKFKHLPRGFKSDYFLKSILDFTEKKCAQGVNYFHIVKLFWLIYKDCPKNNLEFVIFCIKKPQDILRYVLHQLMRPEIEGGNINIRLKKLNQYKDSFVSVYEKTSAMSK